MNDEDTRPTPSETSTEDPASGSIQFWREPAPPDEAPASSPARVLGGLRRLLEVVESRVLPLVFESKAGGEPVRVWIPGCATGEIVYTLAISLAEYAERDGYSNDIEVFGTDLDPAALALARKGCYSLDAFPDMAPERRGRFFHRDRERLRISRRIRDGLVFSVHDLLSDPPLSSMDLAFCGGLILGRTAELGELAFAALGRALVPGGALVLGASEKVAPPGRLFAAIQGVKQLYRRRAAPAGRALSFRRDAQLSARTPLGSANRPPAGARGEALLLHKYAPPCAVVDEAGEVLRFIGNTGAFLEPPPGLPTNNLIRLARPELREVLRGSFHRAVTHRAPVVTPDVEFDAAAPFLRVRILVTPIVSADGTPPEFAVAFEERGRRGDTLETMQLEITRVREDLVRSTEEFQYTNEELRSANEELLCRSEELCAANEELEVLMEELRTAQDDGSALVRDLEERLEESNAAFTRARERFLRLAVPALVLNERLEIEDYNDASAALFRIIETDRGRPLSDIAPRFRHERLMERVSSVFPDGEPVRTVIQTEDGRFAVLSIRSRPGAKGVEITAQEVDAVLVDAIRASGALDSDWAVLQERGSVSPEARDSPPSSLANFAAEIAHEIKDPLNTVCLSADYALRLDDPQRVQLALRTIRDAAYRCGRIVKSVLGLVRHETSSRWLNDVHVIVRHAAALLESYLAAGTVEMEWQLARTEALCLCNPTELEQVFVNLFKNAVQATQPKKCCLVVSSSVAGDHVVVVVSDNGPGIPASVAERVFDRLYSTRRTGGGTGLGLPLAKEILASHGGTIRLLPSPSGSGTAVEVTLPRAEPPSR